MIGKSPTHGPVRGVRGGWGRFLRRTVPWSVLGLVALTGAVSGADLWGAAGHPGGVVLVGTEGRILFSTGSPHSEYGVAPVPDSTQTFFDAAWIENVNRFVAVGTNGTILVSSNTQGNAWSERTAPTLSTLHGVADFEGNTRAVAVGEGGTIIRTTSAELGGWVTVDSPTDASLWDVVRGNNVSVAVGEDGTILKGNLDGTSWEIVDPPDTSKDLHGVSLEETGHFLAVGESGLILRGNGDATSWQTINPPNESVTLWDVVGGGIQIIPSVAVGTGGSVWVSNDTGLSWDDVETSASATLRGVAYTGNEYIACGDSEVILWSDTGFVWENVTAIRPTTWGRLKHIFSRP